MKKPKIQLSYTSFLALAAAFAAVQRKKRDKPQAYINEQTRERLKQKALRG